MAPRDVVAACLPDPAHLGDHMFGKTCAGTWVKGTKDGKPRQVYLYQVADNETCMRDYGVQAVVWQTAVNPVIAMELIEAGIWKGAGVFGPEAFDPDPFVERMPRVWLSLGPEGDGLTRRAAAGERASGDPRALLPGPGLTLPETCVPEERVPAG